jgi:hypothetical protein
MHEHALELGVPEGPELDKESNGGADEFVSLLVFLNNFVPCFGRFGLGTAAPWAASAG